MSAGDRQLQNRAGSNVPTRVYSSALARALLPAVHLDDALGDQLIAECPKDALILVSGPGAVAGDFGTAFGTSGPGLAGKIFLVDAQGNEIAVAPIAAPLSPPLSGVTYSALTFGPITLSPGEKFIYRPFAATAGKGVFNPSLYYTTPGPGAVQQSIVDLSDGEAHTLFEAPPGKGIQLVPFGTVPPASWGSSITAAASGASSLDVLLRDEGIDYSVLLGQAVGPLVLNPIGAALTGSLQLLLSPGQALRARRTAGAAAERIQVRSMFQLVNVEDA